MFIALRSRDVSNHPRTYARVHFQCVNAQRHSVTSITPVREYSAVVFNNRYENTKKNKDRCVFGFSCRRSLRVSDKVFFF